MQPEATQPGAGEIAGAEHSDETAKSKARRRTFSVVAVFVALWLLVLHVFGLLEVVLMWLPTDTLASMLPETAAEIDAHRFHFMAIGVVSWALALAMLVQVRKPERRVAPLMLLVVMAVSALVLFGLSGTVGEWLIEEVVMLALPVGLVVLLHPSRGRLLERPGLDRLMAVLAAVATVPWLAFVIDNAGSQWDDAAGDPHAAPEHWGIAALAGVIVVVAAWLGASRHPGWRLTAWIAVGASLLLGMNSAAFPDTASSLSMFWAVAASVWAIGFAAATVRRARAQRHGTNG